MPAVVPVFVGAAVTAGLTSVAGSLAASVIGGIVAGALGRAIAPSSAMDKVSPFALENGVSNTDVIPVVYGTRRVGMTRVFAETSDGTVFADEFLHVVASICEGEISAISTVYLDDVASDNARFSGLVSIEKYLGTDDQTASSALVAALSSGSPLAAGRWTTNHRGRGVAYAYIRLKWSPDAWPQGLPVVTFDVNGKKVWDPRLGSPTTTAFSDNPALAILDYLMNSRYGRGVSVSKIDVASFIDAANYCDETIPVPSSGSPQSMLKRYRCNGILIPGTGERWIENIRALESSCRGHLVYAGGVYRLLLEKVETPTAFAFTEDNIVGAWNFRKGGQREKFNRVRARFFNPNRRWQEDFRVYDNSTHRTADGGRLLDEEIALPFTTQPYIAQELAQLEEQCSRFPLTAEFTATIAGMQCEVGDVVPITHSTPGWSAKSFRVERIGLLSSSEVRVAVREYQAEAFDLSGINEDDVEQATNLPDAFNPSPPTGLAFEQHATVWDTAILTWSNADQAAREFQIEYKVATGSDYTIWGRVPAISGTEAHTAEVTKLRARRYDFRVKVINNAGVSSTYATVQGSINGPQRIPLGDASGSGSILKLADIAVGDNPVWIEWVQDQNLLYVSIATLTGGANRLDIINPDTDELIDSISLSQSPTILPVKTAYCPTNKRVYMTYQYYPSSSFPTGLLVIDPKTQAVTPVSLGSPQTVASGGEFCFSPVDGLMYLARLDNATWRILAIDPDTDSVFDVITPPGSPAASISAMCYCPTNQKIYFHDGSRNSLTTFDPITRAFVEVVAMSLGQSGKILYCPTSDRLYITDAGLHRILVVNPTTNEHVATLETSGSEVINNPTDIIYSPLVDTIYQGNSSGSDFWINAIFPDTHEIVATETLGLVRKMLWVPSVSKIYTVNQQDDSISSYAV